MFHLHKFQKYIYLFSVLFLFGLFFIFPKFVFAEQINNLTVEIAVNADSSLDIQESIAYDFGTEMRHGIFRDIPYSYTTDVGKFKLRLSNFSVSDEKGQPITFTTSSQGGETQLKIGDADIYVTGVQQYVIKYTVKRAINYFPDHDELYWNAIGSGWTVPINQSKVIVKTPANSDKAVCYVGQYGSTEQKCSIEGLNSNLLTFINSEVLAPAEFFTVVVSLPAGTLHKPTWQENLLNIVKDNSIVVLPVFVFIAMYFVWRKYGKDAAGRGTIVAQYDPPQNLSPIFMGTLVDGKLDNRDLAAEIIYLATQGYLKIEHIETKKLLWFKGKDYQLTKLKEAENTLSDQTKKLFTALFKSGTIVKLSDFKKDTAFGKSLGEVKSGVFKDLKTQGYYRNNPNVVIGLYIALAFVVGFVSLIVASPFGIIGILSGFASGIIVLIFGIFMPARTKQGSEMREYILGLKTYLNVAEKDRLDFTDAPEKKPERFEKLLPFAVALGVEKQWAKQFEGIYNQQPSWYNDSTGTAFNVALLSNSIGDFSTSMQSAVTAITTSAAGGSGFSGGGSGGGGGGGGGGSW